LYLKMQVGKPYHFSIGHFDAETAIFRLNPQPQVVQEYFPAFSRSFGQAMQIAARCSTTSGEASMWPSFKVARIVDRMLLACPMSPISAIGISP